MINFNEDDDAIEIYWDDLTEDAQQRLKDMGYYHGNIELYPLFILNKFEEDI